MMTELEMKKCLPCKQGGQPLKGAAITELLSKLGDGWNVIDEHHLEKEYTFKNFKDALGFTNRVGAVAEKEGHHPDICLGWGKVKLILWTHSVNGLTENDFILAAKSDKEV